jgi:hypothetical protein
VRIPSALAEELVLLTDALDIDGVDVASTMQLLTSAVVAAVPSYVGMSVRLTSAYGPVDLATTRGRDPVESVATSIRLPLVSEHPTLIPPVVIVLYASVPGAFVDLAADLAWLTGRSLDDIGLDTDLHAVAPARTVASLSSLSIINQAVGVLVGRGLTPEEALDELDTVGSRPAIDRHANAVAVLDSLSRPGGDTAPDAD